MFVIRFIKAQPTTYLMKYRAGAVTREGAGLSTQLLRAGDVAGRRADR